MHKMLKEIYEQPAVMKRCFESNVEIIRLIAKNIKERNINNIIFVARGSSDNAATFGRYVIEILSGIPVGLAAPSVASLYKRDLQLEKTCVIGVSQSGQSEDICSFLDMAKRNRAMTIAITNNPSSKLSLIAEYKLNMNVGVEEAIAATKSFTAEIVLLELFAAFLAEDDKLVFELSNIENIIEDALSKEGLIKENIERFRYMNECFILGRGVSFPIALEFALKIQETSYVRAKGFSTSDFRHGPLAMIDKNIPVFIVAPVDETIEDNIEIAERLIREGIDIITFSDSDELNKKACKYIEIRKDLNKFLKPLFAVPLVQLFSYYLCVLKGNDPDKPRHLSKVTITK